MNKVVNLAVFDCRCKEIDSEVCGTSTAIKQTFPPSELSPGTSEIKITDSLLEHN